MIFTHIRPSLGALLGPHVAMPKFLEVLSCVMETAISQKVT